MFTFISLSAVQNNMIHFIYFNLQIPVADGDRGYGGFATLDVESVNLIKYPKFKDVRWKHANMTPGDCLYLPYSK